MAQLLADAVALQRILRQLSRTAATDVTAMWNDSDGWQDVEDLYPDVVDRYAGAAGSLAAQWYYDLNPDKPFETRTAAMPERGRLLATVGWAFTQPNTLNALVGATERYVFTTARETVVSNAVRERVRWARHASANACAWCQVLATNEPRYGSEEAAIAGHDNCNCMAVPVREGTEWTPAPYVEQWREQYNAARDEVGGNLNDIVNYLRRQD